MQYIKGMQAYENKHRTAITLGKFDGLHMGHEMLIASVVKHQTEDAVDSVVFAFDMAPFFAERKIDKKGLLTNEERAAHLCGRIDYFVECPFDEQIAKMSAETFIKEVLVDQFHAKYIVVGSDFHFGHQKKGDYHMLQQYSEQYDYQVEVIEKICHEGREISSTFIREELVKGNMELVNTLLGYRYCLSGVVEYGKQLGRQLGFPTMNIVAEKEKLLPPNGVYVSTVQIDGQVYGGISNIGCKPTVSEEHRMGLETYVFGYEGNAYGHLIEVELLEFVRPEQKFSSVDALRARVHFDMAYGEKYFQNKCLH